MIKMLYIVKCAHFQKYYWILVVLLCLLTNFLVEADPEDETIYDYEHIEQWVEKFPGCGGQRQSPITVNLKDVPAPKNSTMVRVGYEAIPSIIFLNNTGHTVELEVIYDGDNPLTYSSGPLDGEYKFSTITFRWGKTNGAGSEHIVDGKTSTMEIQFFFYKKEFGSLATAWDASESMMASTQLVELTDDPEKMLKGYQIIQPLLAQVREPGSTIKVDPFPMQHFVDPNFLGNRYGYYKGSITFPPCKESVSWIVHEPVPLVTAAFVKEFRKINLSYGDKKNHRPVQGTIDQKVEVFTFV